MQNMKKCALGWLHDASIDAFVNASFLWKPMFHKLHYICYTKQQKLLLP